MSEREAKIKVPKNRLGLHDVKDPNKFASEMAEIQQENDFLRQYAGKLEEQLKVYQTKYPELNAKIPPHPATTDLPPWVANAKYMNPLLIAYQRKIDNIAEEKDGLYKEVKELRNCYQSVLKLSKNIPQSIRPEIKSLLPSQKVAELKEAKQRADLLRQQVEVVEKQNKKLTQELSKEREDSELARAQAAQAEATIKHLSESKRKADHAIGLLAAEKDVSNNRIKEAQNQISALDQARQRLKAAVKAKEQEIARHLKSESALAEKAEKLAQELIDSKRERDRAIGTMAQLEAKLLGEEQTISGIRRILKEQERRVQALSKQVSLTDRLLSEARNESETARKELIKRRREAAEAQLNRDKLAIAERSAREELARKMERANQDLAKVRHDAKETHKALFTSHRQREANLDRRIKDSELEAAMHKEGSQSVQRQLASVQAQFETLKRIGLEKQASLADAANKAQVSSRRAETGLQLAEEKIQRLQKRLEQGEVVWAEQRSKMSKENEAMRTSLDRKGVECAAMAGELKLLSQETQALRERTESVERMARKTEQDLKDRLADAEEHFKKEIGEMSSRLDEAYKMHEEAEERGEKALSDQSQITQKWKRLHETTSKRLRSDINQLKLTLKSHRARNSELEEKTTHLFADREQAQMFQIEYEKRCQHLESIVATLKARNASAKSKLDSALAREPGLIEEVQRLQESLHQTNADKQRLLTEKNQAIRKLALAEEDKALDFVDRITDLAKREPENHSHPLLIETLLSPSRRKEEKEETEMTHVPPEVYAEVLKELDEAAANAKTRY